MTVYWPQGMNTGAAVVVFPGGGYKGLAIDLEGTEVCDWLTSKGITCVLLKYRVPFSGPYWDDGCKCHRQPKAPMALEDAQRTVGLVRFHAAEWHIDPRKIGVLGFSAAGHIVAGISTHFDKPLYPIVDATDKERCRPDFAVALYPGHLSLAENTIALNPDIRTHITHHTSPTFLLQNEDDHVDRVEDSLRQSSAQEEAIRSQLDGQRSKSSGSTEPELQDGRQFWREQLVALERDKARFCYQICRALNVRRIVEAGTSFGVSTLYLELRPGVDAESRRNVTRPIYGIL